MILKDLVEAKDALTKLFRYGYLRADQGFYLSTIRQKVACYIDSYHEARNNLLRKYGTSEDGENFNITGTENVNRFRDELEVLNQQEVDLEVSPQKLTLSVDELAKGEEMLSPEQRLGFNSEDWERISKIINVMEGVE